MSDNYHQAVMGGTGANHIMMGTGDDVYFSDVQRQPAAPPHNRWSRRGRANQGYVDEIENPNAAPSTNNWYAEDGYGGGSYGSRFLRRRNVHAIAPMPRRLAVPAIINYLASLPTAPIPIASRDTGTC